MKNIWSILCNNSIRDGESKMVSIINVVDSFGAVIKKDQVGKKVFVNIPLELVSCWSSFGEKFENFIIKVELFDPQNNNLMETELNVEKDNQKNNKNIKNVTTNLSIKSFPVNGSGIYIFKISKKGSKEKSFKAVSKIPVNVKVKISE
jgi:hypothetical protein